jgi:hypothetical protein
MKRLGNECFQTLRSHFKVDDDTCRTFYECENDLLVNRIPSSMIEMKSRFGIGLRTE